MRSPPRSLRSLAAVGLGLVTLAVGVRGASAAAGDPVPTAVAGAPANPPPRRARPWAVRSEVFILSGSGQFGATAGSVGLTVQKAFFERWAWEETVSWGLGNRRVAGQDIGLNLAGTLRFAALYLTPRRTSALTVGLGSALVLGGGYGRMNFAFAELGYEYRSPSGFSALLAAGPNWLFQAPKRSVCDPQWLCDEFHRGSFAPLGHVRLGLGWAF